MTTLFQYFMYFITALCSIIVMIGFGCHSLAKDKYELRNKWYIIPIWIIFYLVSITMQPHMQV